MFAVSALSCVMGSSRSALKLPLNNSIFSFDDLSCGWRTGALRLDCLSFGGTYASFVNVIKCFSEEIT